MKCNYCKIEILSTFFYCPSCGKCTRIDTPKQVKNTDPNAGCSWCSNTSTNSGVGQKILRSFVAEFEANRLSQAVSNK